MLLVVNPAAAGGRLGREWPRLHARLRRAGFDPPFVFTEAPGHATQLAAEAVKARRDRGRGRRRRRDDLRGRPGPPRRRWRRSSASCRWVPATTPPGPWVCRSTSRPRSQVIKAGDDAAGRPHARRATAWCSTPSASACSGRSTSTRLGSSSCAGSPRTWPPPSGTLFSYDCPEIALSTGPFKYRGRMTILAIHSGVTTGGGFRLTPAALPDDGILDALLVEATSVPDSARPPGGCSAGHRCEEARLPRAALHAPGAGDRRAASLPLRRQPRSHIEPPGMTFEVLPGAQEVLAPPSPVGRS